MITLKEGRKQQLSSFQKKIYSEYELSKLQEMVKGQETWRDAVHGVAKSWTPGPLNNNKLIKYH